MYSEIYRILHKYYHKHCIQCYSSYCTKILYYTRRSARCLQPFVRSAASSLLLGVSCCLQSSAGRFENRTDPVASFSDPAGRRPSAGQPSESVDPERTGLPPFLDIQQKGIQQKGTARKGTTVMVELKPIDESEQPAAVASSNAENEDDDAEHDNLAK